MATIFKFNCSNDEPTIESWLMEFKLKPFYHYVPIKKDFSDIMSKLDGCNSNVEKWLKNYKFNKLYYTVFNLRKEKLLEKSFQNILKCLIFKKSFNNKNKKFNYDLFKQRELKSRKLKQLNIQRKLEEINNVKINKSRNRPVKKINKIDLIKIKENKARERKNLLIQKN